VTYREAALLVDAKESSVATLQRVAQVVAHGASGGHQRGGEATPGFAVSS
jgi:aminopeptidase N